MEHNNNIIFSNVIFRVILKYCWESDTIFSWCPFLNNDKIDPIISSHPQYREVPRPTPFYNWKMSLLFISKDCFRTIVNNFPFQISDNTYSLQPKELLYINPSNNNNNNNNINDNNNNNSINNNRTNVNNINNNKLIKLYENQFFDVIEKDYFYFENFFDILGKENFKKLFGNVKRCKVDFDFYEPIDFNVEILNSIGTESTVFIFYFSLTKEKENIKAELFEPISNLNIETIVINYPCSSDYYDPTINRIYKIIKYCSKTIRNFYILNQKHITHFLHSLRDLSSIEKIFLSCEIQNTYGAPIFNLNPSKSIGEYTFQVSDGDGEYVDTCLSWISEISNHVKSFNFNILSRGHELVALVQNLKELESLSFYTNTLDLTFFQINSSNDTTSSIFDYNYELDPLPPTINSKYYRL
ncbi:hypothetical protein DICPUDRAFT_153985 [Dictyostelium purpureum]|uniref:Uncharacterized protein n=1 Tax=Dictyostelium purpureum TaxID=5786 RepID=F0ZQ93_DICPU|nr:uncharacterized protein DICPUDRAFT_153985 [Dictyostelium purpureum]EGC33897.1 hypothetical protein DICPUDRAFT_153985 [Dictyostelium purpureum]|eukprot:XP_003289580.1 hypothetical protein DICPUDRAFT_153985 [Dictyostelium purpureum]